MVYSIQLIAIHFRKQITHYFINVMEISYVILQLCYGHNPSSSTETALMNVRVILKLQR